MSTSGADAARSSPDSELVRPAYRVVTERLVARCCEPADAAARHGVIEQSAAALRLWMPWMHPAPPSFEAELESVRRWRADFDRGAAFVYGLFEREDGTCVGSAGLHPRPAQGAMSIGYWVRTDRHRRGYASEAAAALTRIGFELLRVELLEILCEPANVASAGVARRLGYARDALLRRRIRWPNGERRDEEVWSLFADEYAASPSATAIVEGYDVLGRRLL